MSDRNTIFLRETVIGGMPQTYDYTVFWHTLPIGRIIKPSRGARWRWACNVDGRLSPGGLGGSGASLDQCLAMFMTAWTQVHADLNHEEIARTMLALLLGYGSNSSLH